MSRRCATSDTKKMSQRFGCINILPNFAARKKNVRSLLHARRKVVILRSTNKPIKVRTMDLIKIAEQAFQRENAPEIPEFKAGDTVNVNYRIIEGNKERIQAFKGVVRAQNVRERGSGAYLPDVLPVHPIPRGIAPRESASGPHLLFPQTHRKESQNQRKENVMPSREKTKKVRSKRDALSLSTPATAISPKVSTNTTPPRSSPHAAPPNAKTPGAQRHTPILIPVSKAPTTHNTTLAKATPSTPPSNKKTSLKFQTPNADFSIFFLTLLHHQNHKIWKPTRF